ncbi:MAG: SusC/RagA family TonB-linked outer membrane protein, partial [Parabacteroides sp.]|nr:SusC/RagA family TonB-linked outer membrane protein [Parabacteroides sp.]
NSSLVFSYVGMRTETIPVNGRTSINVVMTEDTELLSEVVVTALGIKREKKSLGYALQEIKGDEIVQAREINVTNALSGKIAGLQVVKGSNGIGGSSKIVLRGNNSLTGDNQPLIVVDGIPMDNFTGASNNDFWNPSMDMGNGLGDLNPEDIASLSVLKGASAAALYGSRAGNGVILITTKTGSAQKGHGVTFSSTTGFENVFMIPDVQKAFGQGSNGVYDSESGSSWGPKIEGQEVEKWDKSKAAMQTFDNIGNFMRTGVNTQNSVALSRQLGKGSSIYSSLTHSFNNDIAPGSKLERLNLISRFVSNFGKDNRWTTDVKIQYINTSVHNRPIGGNKGENFWNTVLTMPSTVDIREFKAGVNEFGNHIWYNPKSGLNPYWAYKYNINDDNRDRFLMNGSVKYQFTDWLTGEIKAGTDLYTTNTESKTYGKGPLTSTGKYSLGKNVFNETNLSYLFSANKDDLIGKMGAAATFGGNLMSRENSSISSSTGELEVPNLFSLNNAKGNPGVSQGYGLHKINSLYGTLQFNYDKYLFLDFTGRNDWSSTLSKDNRSFFYPSVSTSFVFSELIHKSSNSLPWLTYGKLRASYAAVGNDMGPYQLYNFFTIGKDPNGNTTASRNNVLYNPDVKNELIKSTEIGLEVKFLNNRLGFDLALYKSNATNQLLNIPINPLSGYAYKKINAGDIENKGFELMLNARPVDTQAFAWDVSANIAKNINTVLELSDEVTQYGLGWPFENIQILAATGERYGTIYGSKFARVEDEKSEYYGKIIVDENGIPTAAEGSHYLGNQQPNLLLGLTNTLTYKNLSFSVLLDARFGGKIYSYTNYLLKTNGRSDLTVIDGERTNIIYDGVLKDGDKYVPNTKEVSPQILWTTLAGRSNKNVGITEDNLYDATNIRIRNIALNYQVPSKWMQSIGAQSGKVGVSANNLWMIKSHLNGVDPESVYATGTNAVGLESLSPPTTRAFYFNISVSF